MVLAGWDGVGTAACQEQRWRELPVPKLPCPQQPHWRRHQTPRKGVNFLTHKNPTDQWGASKSRSDTARGAIPASAMGFPLDLLTTTSLLKVMEKMET